MIRAKDAGPRRLPRWPLVPIASPAAVAVWSGWVGLGGLAGFGVVHPLPGIVPGLRLNTAITLPVGVEAYAAYALAAWLGPWPVGKTARAFARNSAIGALALGMLGQIAYHLLAAAHAARAPWPVTVAVACMPVITLGFGAALTHLLGERPGEHLGGAPQGAPRDAPGPLTASAPKTTRKAPAGRSRGRPRRRGPVTPEDAEREFVGELASGTVPSIRQVRARMHVGDDRARTLRDHLEQMAGAVSAGAIAEGG